MDGFLQAINNFFKGIAGEILLAVLFCLMALPAVIIAVIIDRKNNALIIKHGTFGYKRHKNLGERLGIIAMIVTFVLMLAIAWLSNDMNMSDWLVLLAMALLAIVYFLPRIIFELVFYCRVKKKVKLSCGENSSNSTPDEQSTQRDTPTNGLSKE